MVAEGLSVAGNIILDPLYSLWSGLIAVLPGIVGAIIVLIFGYAVSWFIGHIVKLGLEKARLRKSIEKAGLTRRVGRTDVISIIGEVVKWFIFVIFLQQASEILNLGAISSLLNSFVMWFPNLIISVLILFAGIAFAHYLEIKIRENTSMKGMAIGAAVLKIVVLVLVMIVALTQIGIDVSILERSFLILLGAFAGGIALALGIGLGLGLRKNGEEVVRAFKKDYL